EAELPREERSLPRSAERNDDPERSDDHPELHLVLQAGHYRHSLPAHRTSDAGGRRHLRGVPAAAILYHDTERYGRGGRDRRLQSLEDILENHAAADDAGVRDACHLHVPEQLGGLPGSADLSE